MTKPWDDALPWDTWGGWHAKFEEGDFVPRAYENEHQLNPGEPFGFVFIYNNDPAPYTEVGYRHEVRRFPGKWKLQLKPDGRLLLVRVET